MENYEGINMTVEVYLLIWKDPYSLATCINASKKVFTL